MEFDNSWDAVLKPGKATVYFDVLANTNFEADATSYSKTNAWWLAELCRLVYRQGTDEDEHAKPPTRKDVLASVKLDEVEFFNEKDSQAALVKTTDSSGVRFAALVLRGTDALMDWVTDINVVPVKWAGPGMVHKGFKEGLDKIWTKVAASLDSNVPADCPFFIAGHSLGAALAMLAGALKPPRALYTYGCPRVGDETFGKAFAGKQVYRVRNNRDVVTTVPPDVTIHHVGELHYITHDGDMLINPTEDQIDQDLAKRDRLPFFSRDWHRFFTDAPEPIADHAPVNYVAHLERQV